MSYDNRPSPDAPFTDIWDWYYYKYRDEGFDDSEACLLADDSAAGYAR